MHSHLLSMLHAVENIVSNFVRYTPRRDAVASIIPWMMPDRKNHYGFKSLSIPYNGDMTCNDV